MDADVSTENSSPRKRRGCFGRLVRVGLIGGGLALVLAAVGGGVGAWLYQEHVVRNPGPHLERDYILGVVAQESPVYYRDGTTRIGVFFEDEHREFVAWNDLPPAYVAALIAAEDGSYWSHQGVSPKHIARALVDNLRAGHTVSGGSTLTQQTAKNLYYRPDRSWRSKWTEMINALRLEAHYDKEEILTFYVNQFHVSGNGRGVGIASRYFFDKDVSELGLLESAFLAGLVKGPYRYDPFIGDAERQARSRERAHTRTRYVLKRIVDEDPENLIGPWPVEGSPGEVAAHAERQRQVEAWKVEAQKLLDEDFELPFQKGQFRYDSNAVLDEVRRRLAEPPFDEVLATAGIEDPDSAGLQVVTTLDPDAQREAIYGLWHHLTEVGTWMEGLTASDFVRADSRGPRHDPYHLPTAHEFRLGRITGHPDVNGRTELDVDLGGHACRVDRDGVVRAALAVKRGQDKNPYSKVPGAEVDAFAQAMADDAVVWVSVREAPEGGPALCDLEVRPELQGSVVVLEDGAMRAMVGGNDNRNFNRATALRQFGSTWKPLVFHAALELGWRPDDALDNQRNVFPFSTTMYYPRPDHTPEPVVSMAWAGVRSENLASIWLLYHLTDKLDGEQVRVLASALDLARREGEDEKAYRTRIQKAGVLPTRGRLREVTFLQARQDALSSLGRSGHPDDQLALTSLLYGWGYDKEAVGLPSTGWKARAVANRWTHLEGMLPRCERQHGILDRAVQAGVAPNPLLVPDITVKVDAKRVEVACGTPPEGFVPPDADALATALPEPELPSLVPDSFTPPDRPRRSIGERLGSLLGLGGGEPEEVEDLPEADPQGVAEWKDVLVDDRLHVETLLTLQRAIQRRDALLSAREDVDLYAPDLLYNHQDFRVLLALRYVAELARQYGVRSEVRPVLSLPLGASEITLEEAASVYEGISTGQAWTFPGRASQAGALLAGREVSTPPSPTLLIAEIRDVDGRVIYKAEPEAREVAEPDTADMTSDILANVVEHGTGRRANGVIALGGAPVPLGGKTGTTNDFRNAAFLGFAPGWSEGGWSVSDGVTIGAYVGYDDNRAMSRGRIRLAGASGALPAWIATARGLAEQGLLGAPDAPVPEGGWVLAHRDGLVELEVEGERGLPVSAVSTEEEGTGDSSAGTILAPPPEAVPATPAPIEIHFGHVPTPVRVAPSTREATEAARRRRELLERLRDRPSLWDGVE